RKGDAWTCGIKQRRIADNCTLSCSPAGINRSAYAKHLGSSSQTAWGRGRPGDLPAHRLPSAAVLSNAIVASTCLTSIAPTANAVLWGCGTRAQPAARRQSRWHVVSRESTRRLQRPHSPQGAARSTTPAGARHRHRLAVVQPGPTARRVVSSTGVGQRVTRYQTFGSSITQLVRSLLQPYHCLDFAASAP